MAGLGDLLGASGASSTLTQIALYQIVGQLIGGALEPYFRSLGYKVNARTPNAELTPAELSALVERGYWAEDAGAAAAAKFGIDGSRFSDLVKLQETAPPPEWLAVALRRGIIAEASGDPEHPGFDEGIRQGTIAYKWRDVIKQMAINLPSPEMALEAFLEGQTDRGTAEKLYAEWGGAPEFFDLLFNTRGQAPTPMQALEMLNRKIIPESGRGPGVVSYEQAFLEGPWRDKWLPAFRQLGVYVPPPRTITAMVREGSLTDEQALAFFTDAGMTDELAAAYLASAHHQKTDSVHELARSTLQELYRDRIITREDLITALKEQGWSDADADYLAQVVDVRRQQQAMNSFLTRAHTLYVGHKIEATTVREALDRLEITGERQADILELWTMERDANAKDLTPAQVEAALFYKVIEQGEAQQLLEHMGYTPHDAWLALSVRMHKKLDGEPPRDAIPGGN